MKNLAIIFIIIITANSQQFDTLVNANTDKVGLWLLTMIIFLTLSILLAYKQHSHIDTTFDIDETKDKMFNALMTMGLYMVVTVSSVTIIFNTYVI